MITDVYEHLAKHLADLPGDFLPTTSGVELRILKRLFTPEEADLASRLILLPETARTIAFRARKNLAETQHLLDSLERKRLVMKFALRGRAHYMAQQFVIGFWETQVDRLDRELVEDFEEYLPVYGDAGWWGKAPQLRTIPIHKSITLENNVMPYEQLDAILDSHSAFALANCICRQEMDILGRACGKPMETCLAFDGAAHHFAQTGRGRLVTRQEANEVIASAEKNGLVLQPGNTLNPGNICMCCGCCCGVLRSIKCHPKPASQVSSNYYAKLDTGKCTGCGVCVSRCQMEALTLVDGKASLNLDRCIGCGLCVTTCPAKALVLLRKPKREIPSIPANNVALAIRMGRTRGKLRPWDILWMLLRSGFDRLLGWLTVR